MSLPDAKMKESLSLPSPLSRSRKFFWAVLGGIVVLGAIILLLAPDEQTLGKGIKSIYVHVAFTWTGMSGLLAAGLLGIGASIFSRPKVQAWGHTVAWVALFTFALGLVMSVIAANINWGAIFWQEPRTNSALQILAFGVIVQIINGWSISYRLKGMLQFMLAAFLGWSIIITPLILHPGNAARTTPSTAIRLTFLSLFALCSLAALWITINWRQPGVQEE